MNSLDLETSSHLGSFGEFGCPQKKRMRFINLTRQTEIGANSYFLELDGKKLVLDAGLHPKQEGDAALPHYRSIPDGSLDAILISHAHQDHIGSLPVLMRRQPQARVFMTARNCQAVGCDVA